MSMCNHRLKIKSLSFEKELENTLFISYCRTEQVTSSGCQPENDRCLNENLRVSTFAIFSCKWNVCVALPHKKRRTNAFSSALLVAWYILFSFLKVCHTVYWLLGNPPTSTKAKQTSTNTRQRQQQQQQLEKSQRSATVFFILHFKVSRKNLPLLLDFFHFFGGGNGILK